MFDLLLQCLLRPFAFKVFFIITHWEHQWIRKIDFASIFTNIVKKNDKKKKKKIPFLSLNTLSNPWSCTFFDVMLSFYPNTKVFPEKLKHKFLSNQYPLIRYFIHFCVWGVMLKTYLTPSRMAILSKKNKNRSKRTSNNKNNWLTLNSVKNYILSKRSVNLVSSAKRNKFIVVKITCFSLGPQNHILRHDQQALQ